MKSLIVIILLFSSLCFSQVTWNSQLSGTTKKLNSVHFINTTTGFAVGDTGIILKTTNGGLNWNTQAIGYSGDLKSVYFIDENLGFVAGGINSISTGAIYKTTNGGLNWNATSSLSRIINCVNFTNNNVGYAVGGRNLQQEEYICKTINGGNTWNVQLNSSNEYWLNSVKFTNNNTGYAVGYGYILKTTNGGINYLEINSSFLNYHQIFFLNDSVGYISCSNGKIVKTTNYGESWSILNVLGTSDDFFSIFFTSANIGFSVGTGSTIIKTYDAGLTWEALSSPTNQTLKSVFFADANIGYAVGEQGTIIKTTNGGLTSFSNYSQSNNPSEYFLHQNFPNPFNPNTEILIDIPKSSKVKLSIYDISGKLIETLVDNILPKGRYSTKWNSGKFSSGIYFYKLEAYKFVQSKRMVLLK